MKREIKFRAWSTEDKEYCGECMYSSNVDQIVFPINGMLNNHIRRMAKKYIIEQYTGLKDKSGKEIYEGDVIQINLGDSAYNRKVYRHESGAWCVDLPAMGSTGDIGFQIFTISDKKIVGNIHEEQSK